MINEIQPKIKFQNIVQCPFKSFIEKMLQFLITLQNTLIGCVLITMVTNSKKSVSLFCAYFSHVATPQIVSMWE